MSDEDITNGNGPSDDLPSRAHVEPEEPDPTPGPGDRKQLRASDIGGEDPRREDLKSAAEKAVANAGSDDGPVRRPEPEPTPEPKPEPAKRAAPASISLSEGDEGGNRVLILVAAVVGLGLIIGLLVVLSGGGDEAGDFEAGGRIELDDFGNPIITTTTTRPTTQTTTGGTTTETTAGVDPTLPTPTTVATPTTTTTLPPANVAVIYPRQPDGSMTIIKGTSSAVILNNSGGQSAAYVVAADGQVTLGGNSAGAVSAGESVNVAINAPPSVTGDPPHATVTVSIDGQIVATIPVQVT